MRGHHQSSPVALLPARTHPPTREARTPPSPARPGPPPTNLQQLRQEGLLPNLQHRTQAGGHAQEGGGAAAGKLSVGRHGARGEEGREQDSVWIARFAACPHTGVCPSSVPTQA